MDTFRFASTLIPALPVVLIALRRGRYFSSQEFALAYGFAVSVATDVAAHFAKDYSWPFYYVFAVVQVGFFCYASTTTKPGPQTFFVVSTVIAIEIFLVVVGELVGGVSVERAAGMIASVTLVSVVGWADKTHRLMPCVFVYCGVGSIGALMVGLGASGDEVTRIFWVGYWWFQVAKITAVLMAVYTLNAHWLRERHPRTIPVPIETD